jgi:hypothetical protein
MSDDLRNRYVNQIRFSIWHCHYCNIPVRGGVIHTCADEAAERVAREWLNARVDARDVDHYRDQSVVASLAALLRAVAAEEREACAACCDEPTSLSADQRTRETIARRIRARGQR